jgi:hypothetical protein
MYHKMLDSLLRLHFRKMPAGRRLDSLEQDVWRKIHAASAEMVRPWHDKMLLAFDVPQFRMASLAMALVIGIGASPIFTPSHAIASGGDVLGLNVFTVQSPYLHSNLMERMQ